ncbi:MAG: 30S ribosomal protein S13, partial [Deltaproteobacteria bacterium]|nr:30S ribosomal protein S13 [Deltaproteobacteria bacterium]
MPRISGIDLPRHKRIDVALTYIYGLGRPSAVAILKKAGVDLSTKSDHLTDDEV